MWIKRFCCLIMVIIMFFLITSCGLSQTRTSTTSASQKIGILLPDFSVQRWKDDGEYMKKMLENAGYEVDLRYNNNRAGDEIYNIKDMILSGCDLLVICSIDSFSLTQVLEDAKNANIPVIAYQRLILHSDAVSYFIELDRQKFCPLQLEYIERALGLPEADGPFYIEVFSSFKGDGNSYLAMDTIKAIQEYIDSGKIIIKSGRVSLDQTASKNIPEEDQEDVRNLFAECNYGPEGARLDAVWCYSDYQARIVTQELLARGYTPDNFPIITGADCEIESVRNIIDGTQSMSIYWNLSAIPKATVAMAIDILKGNPVEIHEFRDNGCENYVVPTHYVDPVLVTGDNYKEVLVDTGYYTEDELNR